MILIYITFTFYVFNLVLNNVTPEERNFYRLWESCETMAYHIKLLIRIPTCCKANTIDCNKNSVTWPNCSHLNIRYRACFE